MNKLIKTLSKILALFFVFIIVTYSSGLYQINAKSSAGMKNLELQKRIITIINGKKTANGKKITVKVKESGAVSVNGKNIKAAGVNKYAKKYGIKKSEAQYLLACLKLGIIDKKDIKNCKNEINYKDLLIVLSKTEELIYGNLFDPEDIDCVMNKRISNIDKVSNKDEKEAICRVYMSGYYVGTSDGYYSGRRTIKLKSVPSKKSIEKLLDKIINKNKRYRFSPDWQLLRVSDKKLPKMAKYYEYILEDYPNAFYDREFEFMQKTALVIPGKLSEEFGSHEIKIRKAGWDNILKYLKYDYRAKAILKYQTDLEAHKQIRMDDSRVIRLMSQYVFPSELKSFISLQKKERMKGAVNSYSDLGEMLNRAVEYTYNVFNVDYRNIEERELFYAGNSVYAFDSDYISDCIKNETIIECDRVIADPSAIYYQLNLTHNRLQGYVIRLYVHYRIVNDNGSGDNSLVFNQYADERGASLRSVKADKSGLHYRWNGNDGEWRDGYFDVSVSAKDGILYSYYDLGSEKNFVTEMMGGPRYNYARPGGMTFKGAVYCEEAFGEYYNDKPESDYNTLLNRYKSKYGMYR